MSSKKISQLLLPAEVNIRPLEVEDCGEELDSQDLRERLDFGAQLLGYTSYAALIDNPEAMKKFIEAWSND